MHKQSSPRALTAMAALLVAATAGAQDFTPVPLIAVIASSRESAREHKRYLRMLTILPPDSI